QPDDEVTRAELMVEAGQQLALVGDHESALTAYRGAVETGEEVVPDARCFVFSALLTLGHREEAEQLNQELRRARLSQPAAFLFMGEHCEEAGLLDEANRWFTKGVLRWGREGKTAVGRVLIQSRWRVRKAIGFPPDEFDELALEWESLRSVLGVDVLDDLDDLGELDDTDWSGDRDDDELDDDWDEQVARAGSASVARKAPCPCGSGRKYKHCCGRTTTAPEG
ncbi:MAG: SEC-C metal-binding domain-containing protein, partial [Actinomycetes bacterium]